MLKPFGRRLLRHLVFAYGAAKRPRRAFRNHSGSSVAEYLEPRILPVSITTNPDVYDVSKDDVLVVAAADGVTQSAIVTSGGQTTGGDTFESDSGDDPDNSPTFDLTVESLPGHGTLAYLNSDGSFKYTPDAGWAGTDTWTYRVTAQPWPAPHFVVQVV